MSLTNLLNILIYLFVVASIIFICDLFQNIMEH